MPTNGYTDALAYFGLEKLAVVRTPVKQYRRSLQLLQNQDHSIHGIRDSAGLEGIFRDGAIKPSPSRAGGQSPSGVSEAYFGTGRPAFPFSKAKNTSLAVPTSRIVDKPARVSEVPEQAYPRVHAGGAAHDGWNAPTNAQDYTITPHAVPLAPKDYLISPNSTPSLEARIRQLRLRRIPAKTFYGALDQVNPGAGELFR